MALYLGDYRIALDCADANSNVNFVSHAHSDHIAGLRKNRKMIASAITKELVQARKNTELELVEVPRNARLLNAGHMFGSRQLYIESQEHGCSVLYSGDYQIQESYAAERIETTETDVLIIDSTYPFANVTFDDRMEVMESIRSYAKAKLEKGIVVFSSYLMGKAQELIRIFNEDGIVPAVDANIDRINQAYRRLGMELDYTVIDGTDQQDGRLRQNFVYVTSARKFRDECIRISSTFRKRLFTAVATGFAKIMRFDVDVQFALSDHADFRQAVEYISRCNPKTIYTVGSGAAAFSRSLTNFGYLAQPLCEARELGNVMFNTTL